MSRVIKVNSDQLDEVAAQMTVALDEIEKLLNTLESRANELRGGWTGEAALAYTLAHANWDASIRELEAIARRVTAIAKSGSSRFRSMESANAAVWAV